MSQTMGGYPDNLRGGPGSPYPRMRGFRSMSHNMLSSDVIALNKIAKILRAAAKDIEPLVASLNFANTVVDRHYGMKVLDLGADLPALAEEIERDDVAHAQKAAEYV